MSNPGALAVALAAALLAAAGCGAAGSTTGPGASSPAPSINASQAGIPPGATLGAVTHRNQTSRTAAPPVPSSPADTTPRHFGTWFHYRNGLSVKVSAPHGFTPSPWAKRSPGTPIVFRVAVRNQTGSTWNPRALHVHLVSGLTRDVQLFDRSQGVVARPRRPLQNGHEVNFLVGFWVTQPAPPQLLFEPGLGYEDAVVTPRR